MYSLILIPNRQKESCTPKNIIERLKEYNGKILNVGGDETVGKGFVRLKICQRGDINAEKP